MFLMLRQKEDMQYVFLTSWCMKLYKKYIFSFCSLSIVSLVLNIEDDIWLDTSWFISFQFSLFLKHSYIFIHYIVANLIK